MYQKFGRSSILTESSPERITNKINGSCRRIAFPLNNPYDYAFDVRGSVRDELGVGFNIFTHVERQSTGAVEIGSDGRQHGFDEIDVPQKAAILSLLLLLRLPFDSMHIFESAGEPATLPYEKSRAFISGLHQCVLRPFSRKNSEIRREYAQYNWYDVTDARNVSSL